MTTKKKTSRSKVLEESPAQKLVQETRLPYLVYLQAALIVSHGREPMAISKEFHDMAQKKALQDLGYV